MLLTYHKLSIIIFLLLLLGETIIRNNTVEQAFDCRDAMAKVVLRRIFQVEKSW